MTVPARLLAAATAVALALCLLPGTRADAVVGISVLAALAPLITLLRHPAAWLMWSLVAGMLGTWAVSMAVTDISPALAGATQLLGLVLAVSLVVTLYAQHLRARPADRRRHERGSWARRADQAALAVVTGLATAQIATTALSPTAPVGAAWAPVDALVVAVLLRFACSRAGLTRSLQLVLAAGAVNCLYDMVASSSGVRLQPLDRPVQLLWALSMALFVAGALHPSAGTAFSSSSLRHLRPESGRVLGLVALAPVPLVLALLNPGGRLPWLVYVAAGTALAALTTARGAQALAASEAYARLDPLTGLANRRGLQSAYEALLLAASSTGGPVGRLVLLDLDDFKVVNDTHGHESGDQLLCVVADRLRTAVGGAGTVARSGGDEFVLVLHPGAPPVDALLRAALDGPVTLAGAPGTRFDVRASAGWVDLEEDSRLPHALADADIALYTSKATHRGAATAFVPAQRQEVLGQLGLGEDLRRLVAGGSGAGQLFLLHQPLVDLVDGRVLGYEALVRWQHPTRGLLAPDSFLPVAESQGQGAALDGWVLAQACATAAGWPADLTVSVNLGRSSMVDPLLADRVRAALRDSGLDPRRLHLEITEHEALPADAGVAALHELADLGVGVSLDDFGTGYTSLVYLHRYPVGVLKLDRSITGADTSDELIAGLTSLASALGIRVLAEGVETEEQHRRLAGFGIDAGQGWLFGRPVPAADLVHRAEPVSNPM
ncbi:putative bifunctional diguanylate cyclase/phosphodiesterase [Klenkia brasiliensis]|uniref:putative bifunctional diguanylate cyclase/phosphodiesterase n=1 Tax=Klenkia brasiliensis TaxID=333142 RepID=UPI0010421652|nr:bifunctional diguanylate cyclase/phosphodiesterase [Klenkia brasiliensis]